MSLADLTDKIRTATNGKESIEAKAKFDLGETGIVFLDGTVEPPVVSNDDGEADATLTLTPDVLGEILEGELDPTTAFMSGQLTVDGSMEVAMRLSDALQDD